MDLRLENCKQLNIIDCKIEKVIDMSWSKECRVNVEALNLKNTINLGQIRMNWKRSRVEDMIYSNTNNTNFQEKAEQFRLLKENFNSIGQYDDEDSAYVEFRRCEMKSKIFDDEKIPIEVVKKNELKGNSIKAFIIRMKYFMMWAEFYIKRPRKSAKYFAELLIFDKVGGFGTKPRNVFKTMITVVMGFGLIYRFMPNVIFNSGDMNEIHILGNFLNQSSSYQIATQSTGNIPSLLDAIYYSGITFLTVGYGDIHPANLFAKILSVIEGFLGIFLMSYFTVSFVRKLLR